MAAEGGRPREQDAVERSDLDPVGVRAVENARHVRELRMAARQRADLLDEIEPGPVPRAVNQRDGRAVPARQRIPRNSQEGCQAGTRSGQQKRLLRQARDVEAIARWTSDLDGGP